ncbi:MAG: argininosuccinate lyase, partial [Chitinophagaceae bacterium]|nr:argininosuccinate lyase [Chitinophagaceae bacterium]
VPFRDAYKQIGLDIEAGKFTYDTLIQHTHEGSIGNLGTEQVKRQMNEVISSFDFEKVHTAINSLTKP